MASELYLGVMSGSSLDGVDFALVEFDIQSFNCRKANTYAYPVQLCQKLRDIRDASVLNFFSVEQHYSVFVYECLAQFLDGLSANIAAIGLHGHTVLHRPDLGYSIQLANAGYIASKIGIPVIHDFRNQDIALGGVGTPLVARLDADFYQDYQYLLNLGGIANMTIQTEATFSSYDICPCNQILNGLAQRMGLPFDESGQMAKKGQLNIALLSHLSSLEFYQKEAPKSIDNAWVQGQFQSIIDEVDCSILDALRTMTKHIAQQIERAISLTKTRAESSRMLITGGGAFNEFLIDQIKSQLTSQSIEVIKADRMTIEYKEAILMAYLSKLRLEGNANIHHKATGATRSAIAGSIFLP